MANQITDGRTQIDAAESVTPYTDLAGAGAGTLDNEVFIQGANSIGGEIGNSLDGILYDAGSAQDWSNNVFYIWINCALVGLLDTRANAGFTIRFCGATVTNWFEVYVGGLDFWPPSVNGGWTQFVVDITTARADAVGGTLGGTNGTVPATSAIRYVGWTGVTGGTMPRMVDNTWIDEIRRLPIGTPGIVVEGRNGGSTDWDSSDISTQLGAAVGTFVVAPGGAYKINTPIEFGINDSTDHAFTDINKVWLWEGGDYIPENFYVISASGSSGGTTSLTFGIKSGSGDDATGAQGLVISADSISARWSMDFTSGDLDNINMFGCTFQHTELLNISDATVDFTSNVFLDGITASVSGSSQVRGSIIAATTGDGAAYMVTNDLTNIANSSFEFSDGHAIEITGAGTYSFVGNLFSGYGASGSNDAAIYNNSGGHVTINITSGGNTPTYRNGTSATTQVNNNTLITLTGLQINTEIRVLNIGTQSELDGVENSTATFSFSLPAGTDVDIVIHHIDYIYQRIDDFNIPSEDTSIPIQQIFDRNYFNPA